MKSLLRAAAVPLSAIALVAGVGVLRRAAAPETPGAVVERFLDRLSEGRYEPAAELLSPEMRKSTTPAALERWQNEAARGLGETWRARGETEWISGTEAEATGILKAGRRDRRLRFGLERESNRWLVARLDEFWAEDAAPSESIRIRELGRRRGAPRRP